MKENHMRGLKINDQDNVAVASDDIPRGAAIEVDGRRIEALDDIGRFHKIALRDIRPGEPIIKYGVPIGVGTQAIRPGEKVHLHNMKSSYIPTYGRKAADQ